MKMSAFPNAFDETVATWPTAAQHRFSEIRTIILRASQEWPMTESLKWGQPAWRPSKTSQGSTLRVSWSDKNPDNIGIFVHCQTTLAATMRDLYPDSFSYEGNRALHLPLTGEVPEQALDHLARLTFTYHTKR